MGQMLRASNYFKLTLFSVMIYNNHFIVIHLLFTPVLSILSVDSTLASFSLTRNWYKLTSDSSSNSELTRDLRSINALRCLCMFGVILGHSALSLSIVSFDSDLDYRFINGCQPNYCSCFTTGSIGKPRLFGIGK